MNNSLKNVLGGVGILAILVAAIAGWRFVGFYGNSIDPSSVRSFSTSAQGKATVVPDVAEVTLSIVTEGGLNLSTLQEENTQKVNALVSFVKNQDIAEEDIQTTSYNISPRRQYHDCRPDVLAGGQICPPPEIVGYQISQSLRVTIKDFSLLGTILSGATQRGVNSISGPVFTIDDPEEARAQAREKAIDRAKRQAEQTAEAAGFKIGELLAINEGGGGIPFPTYRSLEDSLGADDEIAAPQIEPGSQEVTVNVTLTYRIR